MVVLTPHPHQFLSPMRSSTCVCTSTQLTITARTHPTASLKRSRQTTQALTIQFVSPPENCQFTDRLFCCLSFYMLWTASSFFRRLKSANWTPFITSPYVVFLRSSLPSITGSLMAYQKRKAISSSQLYSRQRMENRCTYMSSHAYLGIRAPNHSGRPKFHWAESCMAQAVHRIDHLWSDAAPAHDQLGPFLSSPRANKYEMLIALQV